MYEYRARVTQILSPEELRCTVDLGFGVRIVHNVTLHAVITKEESAAAAKVFISKWLLDNGRGVVLRSAKVGGSYEADILASVDSVHSLNSELRATGLVAGPGCDTRRQRADSATTSLRGARVSRVF